MSTLTQSPAQPRVDTCWLALPLSARGLLDELTKYVDAENLVSLCLEESAEAHEVGNEIARLLCAHRGELARVRRDVEALIDRGFIQPDGVRIWIDVARDRDSATASLKPSAPSPIASVCARLSSRGKRSRRTTSRRKRRRVTG
jgi:hypothetical protein